VQQAKSYLLLCFMVRESVCSSVLDRANAGLKRNKYFFGVLVSLQVSHLDLERMCEMNEGVSY